MSAQANPKVTVVIPTYNRADTISRAIDSVILQTFEDFELLVVDDASEDNTGEILKTYDDPRIRYLRHKKNQGGGMARNTGIKHSRGDYIAFLDSDDRWLSNKLEKQVAAMNAASDQVGVVYSTYYTKYPSSNYVRMSNRKWYSGDVREQVLKGWTAAPTSLLLIKRRYLIGCGMFDQNLPLGQESDLLKRLSYICEFEYVQEPLAIKHELETDQLTFNLKNREQKRNYQNKWSKIKDIEIDSEEDDGKNTESYWRTTMANLFAGKKINGIRSYYRYLRTFDGNFKKGVAPLVLLLFGKRGYFFVISILDRLYGTPIDHVITDGDRSIANESK